MVIFKATNTGFCFGVERAIKLAHDTAAGNSGPVYIIGDIVHNEKVTAQLDGIGIKKVSSIDEVPEQATLIIKAHGVGKDIYEKAKIKNLVLVDATCPMVKDIHKKAVALENSGYTIVIIGDKEHQEVRGIAGNLKKSIIIETASEITPLAGNISTNKIGVVCQSTQDIENVSDIIKELAKISSELLFLNTICQATKSRQKEIKELAKKSEAVIVVGGKHSANTNRLFSIAKEINPNTFFIQSPQQIKKEWKNFASLAIIGGASTPSEILEETGKVLNEL